MGTEGPVLMPYHVASAKGRRDDTGGACAPLIPKPG